MIKWSRFLIFILPFGLTAWALSLHAGPAGPPALAAPASAPRAQSGRVMLPSLANSLDSCAPITTETYSTIAIVGNPTDRPAETHPDLNLAVRGYTPTNAFRGLVDYGGPADAGAPQLPGLFGNNRTPVFGAQSRVYQWDWANNRRGPVIDDWEVTLAGMVVTPTETIHVPSSGYDIGTRPLPNMPIQITGFEVMVLYASADRITLKYTREDSMVSGYGIHLEGICVEPRLLALYNQLNAAGRHSLPALRAGQALGRAQRTEIAVGVRDTGAFLDPRSRQDWWKGR